jgi:lysophospholipase L1-like esterase
MALRKVFANLALAAGSLGVGLGLLELGLRVALPAPIHFRYPQESYDFDPEVAHVLRPAQRAFTHDREVWINTNGQRGREYTPRPEPGVLRVLALGDSQTFGNGLGQEATWPTQLESELSARAGAGGPRIEVVNGGVPGSDTWQHEILLGRLADLYHPQVAVLAFYVNDVSPSYTPKPERTAEISNTAAKRAAYLVKRSALVSFVLQRFAQRHVEEELAQGRAYSEYILSGAPSPEVESGWQQVRKSLAAMKRECEWRGIDFRVAVLPRRDQVSGANPARAYNERIAAIAAEVGVPILDLLPDLRSAYAAGQGEALFIPWDGHNSAAANAVVARRLAQELLPLATQVAAH